MKKILFWIILGSFFGLLFFIFPTKAEAGWVQGYTKNDGTYVPGYWRSNPNGLKYDNYSWDGNWADAFNKSYYSSTRNYSSNWYTPSWITQSDYYIGKSYYDTQKSYKTYDYNSLGYSYNFWKDPVYSVPSYNSYNAPRTYYTPRPIYTPHSIFTPRSYYTPYNYYNNYNSYGSSSLYPYNGYSSGLYGNSNSSGSLYGY